MSLATLQLPDHLEHAVAALHPWVYRDHLPSHRLQGGEWVRIVAGRASAVGLYDARSPIAVRVFGHKEPIIAEVVQQAIQWRTGLFDADTTAYRLISGECDFLPGITVDLYGRYAVVQTYADSVEVLLPQVIKALSRQLKLRGIVRRSEGELDALWGELPPPELTIQENGLRLIANLYSGQKTGLFLDHRDNRQTVGRFTSGKTVLNLFAYTGAFSLYAARGGAERVTSVDIAPAAMEDAARNFALNGLDPEQHEFIAADCFALLEQYVQEGRRFDVVILDPPSLARAKQNRHAAARAYRKLNALALQCVEQGGLLATASCTSQISPENFRQIIAEAATEEGLCYQVVQESGQAPDHPVPAHFPEGRYLKFLLGRVL